MISEASATRLVGSSVKASRAKVGSFDGWPPRESPATRKAIRATPTAIAPRALTRPSDPQEAAQRDAGADRRDDDRGTEEDQDQRWERDRAVVLGGSQRVAAVFAQRVDDRDLADPQDQYGERAADEADHDPLDQERPADEGAGGADQAHHLDLAAPGEDREPDRVADQQQGGGDQQRHQHGEDDLQRARHLGDLLLGLLAGEGVGDRRADRVRGAATG